ncbi:MAG: hypothetical protein AAGA78_13715 [Pseudomonadota bacterium]
MAEHQVSAGTWAVSLDDAAFAKKLDEILAEVIEDEPLAADLDLQIKRDSQKNMGPEGTALYDVLVVIGGIAGHEALKTATREVVAPAVKAVVKRVQDYLRAEPDEAIKESEPEPKD